MSTKDKKAPTAVPATEEKTMKPSRNFFVFYCIILFLFAAILITLSYLSQEKVERELNDKNQALVSTNEKASGFESRLEQANAKNAKYEETVLEQKEKIDTLTDENTKATKMIMDYQKQIAASEYLWKLVKASNAENSTECLAIISLIDSEKLRNYLSKEGLAELQRIEKKVKGE